MKIFIFFIIFCHFFAGAESSKKKLLLAQKDLSSQPWSYSQTGKQNSIAAGIVLTFHTWPGENKERLIIERLEQEDLIKKYEIQRFKAWIFEWSEWSNEKQAKKICDSLLSDFPSIKQCEPDSLVQPAVDDEVKVNFDVGGANSDTTLRSCNIIPSNISLFDGELSDYWAQQMIGADLLREELEKGDSPDKHLVEVFDVPKRDHDVGVRNLISDNGKHSILPEIGDNAGITHTPRSSVALREANRLLDEVDAKCLPQNDDQDTSNDQTSNQQRSNQQQNTQQQNDSEPVNYDSTKHIIIRDWADENDIPMEKALRFVASENMTMSKVNSPYKEALGAAGESYSPTHRVVGIEHQAKLNEYVAGRTPVNYIRTFNVVWKTATDWSALWKSASGTASPPSHYDLEATYEVDMDKSPALRGVNLSYIFRPPVLDMSGATSISTDLFNWLPRMVLVSSSRKLKIWGKKRVGDGSLTINGVTVTMTMVPGTISDLPGSSKTHGQWEATLTSTQYQTILGDVSTQSNSPNSNSVQQQSSNQRSNGVSTQQQSSSRQRENTRTTSSDQTVYNPFPVDADYDENEHIILRDWAKENNIPIHDVFYFVQKESIPVIRVTNPRIEELVQAGQSYDPIAKVVSNEFRSRLENFANERGPSDTSQVQTNNQQQNPNKKNSDSQVNQNTPKQSSNVQTESSQMSAQQKLAKLRNSYSYKLAYALAHGMTTPQPQTPEEQKEYDFQMRVKAEDEEKERREKQARQTRSMQKSALNLSVNWTTASTGSLSGTTSNNLVRGGKIYVDRKRGGHGHITFDSSAKNLENLDGSRVMLNGETLSNLLRFNSVPADSSYYHTRTQLEDGSYYYSKKAALIEISKEKMDALTLPFGVPPYDLVMRWQDLPMDEFKREKAEWDAQHGTGN